MKYTREPSVKAPLRGTPHAAGYDLFSTEDLELKPYQAILTMTGIRVALPPEHALLILPRSGFSFKNQIIIPNSLGLIDEDYRGVMGITLMWMPDPLSVIELYEVFGEPPAGYCRDKFQRTHMAMRYRSDAVFKVPKEHRIAQAMLIPYRDISWSEEDALPETVRGDGGFGSTGLRAEDASGAPAHAASS